MKVLIIAATHGNELLGVRVYQKMLRVRSPLLEHVDFIVGNPRAFAKATRYTESDLNRSYGVKGTSGYEIQRARDIQSYIAITKPDLVIDMHTTNCEQPTCLILSDTAGEMKRRFLRASHVEKVLQVRPMNDIMSLGSNIIAYEVPNSSVTSQKIDSIINDIARFIDNRVMSRSKFLFKMQDKIYKRDITPEQASTFVNFSMHPLGFVQIMTGNNSYKAQTNYLGFKAYRMHKIKV